jgi:putative lipoic acid-binding regulatory protein
MKVLVDGDSKQFLGTVHAKSREQLDAIYRELTACKSVLMAL